MLKLGQYLWFVFLLITKDTPIPLFSTTFNVLLMKIYLKAVIFFAIVKGRFLIGIHLHQNFPKIQVVEQGKRMKWKERKIGGMWRRKEKRKVEKKIPKITRNAIWKTLLLSFYIAAYFSNFVNFKRRTSVETKKCTLKPTGRIHYH